MNAFKTTPGAGLPLFALALFGCPWIGPELARDRFDVDGDGVAYPDDCDEGDPLVFPGAIEACDGVDQDCDGKPGFEEEDVDQDGTLVCEGDCDDANAAAAPGNAEVCGNGVDEDCVADAVPCRWDGAVLAAGVRITGDASGFGYALATGDWDGDGVVDLAVGSPLALDGDGIETGAVYLFDGPWAAGDRTFSDAQASLYSTFAGALAGVAVANGGGVTSDLVVTTAPGVSDGEAHGAVLRSTAAPVGASALAPLLYGASSLGIALASLGDADDDGYTGLVAVDGSQVVFFDALYDGVDPAHPRVAMPWVCPYPTQVANPGDLDGDGLTDVLVSDFQCGGGAGWVDVIDGALVADGVPVDDALLTHVQGSVEGGYLGYALSGGRDLTGDGLADFAASEVAGGPAGADGTGAFETSQVWVVAGRSVFPDAVLAGDATAMISGPPVRNEYVTGLSAAADLEGDGVADLLLGVPSSDLAFVNAGRVGVFYGPFAGARGWDSVAAEFAGPEVNASIGHSFAALGDVSGDGAEDVAVGSANFEAAGAVYVLFGRGQ